MTHWTASKKALLIENVRSEEIMLSDVLSEHEISIEEWQQWCAAYDKRGENGLRTACQAQRVRQAICNIKNRDEINRRQREKKAADKVAKMGGFTAT